ncbi:MAG: tetratricopeptide repeat protein, partial [Candidatus Poribacteria bacterium]|nr:tetratricopeptide repeat protein [Candidatus Poribacteria bacterium]
MREWCDRHRFLIGVVLTLLWVAFVATHSQDDGKWMEALDRDYKNIDKARNNQGQLHRALVDKWAKEGRLPTVIAEYESRSDQQPDNPFLAYGGGYAFAVRGNDDDLERAAAKFQRAVSLQPDFVMGHFSLGGVHYQLGNATAAIDEYKTCVQLDPTYIPAYYAMGEVFRATEKWEDALAAYENALTNAQRDWARPHYGKGIVLIALGDDVTAEVELRQALTLDVKFGLPYFPLGQIRARNGADAEALELYRSGTQLEGQQPTEIQTLGRIFYENAKSNQAETLFQQALAIKPDDASLHFDLGEAFWAQGKTAEATAAYREAVSRDNGYADRFKGTVRDLFFTASMSADAARVALDKSLAIEPNDAEAHILYAQVETSTTRYAEAIDHYEAAATLAPTRDDVHFPLGDLYYATGQRDQAASAYRRGVELDSTQLDRFRRVGDQAFADGKHGDAIASYDKHLLISPDDTDARYRFARSYEETGEPDAATVQYEQVRAQAPATNDTLERLARLYHGSGAVGKALDVLTELVALQPGNASAHFTRGEILRDMKREDEAIDAFTRTVELDATHVDAFYRLATLYESRDEEKSIANFRRVLELAPNRTDSYFALAGLYLRRKDGDSTIPLLEAGLTLEPRRGRDQYALARLLDERDRLGDALPHYAVAVDVKDDEPSWFYEYARCAHRLIEDADEDARKELPATANAAYTACLSLNATSD